MDVLQKIRLYHEGLWGLLFTGFKLTPEQEEKITLNQYQSELMRNRGCVEKIIQEAECASFTEKGLIAYILTVCDYVDQAQEFFPDYLRVINFFDDSQITILVELICYHHSWLNPNFKGNNGNYIQHIQEEGIFDAAGYLIGCGLRYRLTMNDDQRYRQDIQFSYFDHSFQILTFAFAEGIRLRILDNSTDAAYTGSPFTSSVTNQIGIKVGNAEQRMLIVISLVGIGAFCYPTLRSLSEIQVRYPSVMRVRELLVNFRKHVDKTIYEEYQEEFRGYRQTYNLIIEKACIQKSSKNKDKLLGDSLIRSIEKAFKIYAQYGFLSFLSNDNGGTYRTRNKFRIYLRGLI